MAPHSALQRRKMAICLAVLVIRHIRRRKRGRQVWVRPHIAQHDQLGAFNALLAGLRSDEPEVFTNYSRMPSELFDELLSRVTDRIARQNTRYRSSISPAERLAITLRFLATGESFKSISYQFRVGETTIGKIVPDTCDAIYAALKDDYFKSPSTPEEWQKVADLFMTRWNFPNCLGALDGKHIYIKPPKHSGSTFFNYKHRFSVVLMALVDADYRFLYVDVGCNGRVSDGGVFAGCTLHQALENHADSFPPPKPVPGDERPLGHFIVADDAFPLKEYIMKPFSHRDMQIDHRIFNYRLSRARRVVENAFGILANKFRVFLTNIALAPEKVEKLVMASCALHNFMREKVGHTSQLDSEDPTTHTVTPGSWRTDRVLSQATLPSGTNSTQRARTQRDYLVEYLNSPTGSVPWQLDMV